MVKIKAASRGNEKENLPNLIFLLPNNSRVRRRRLKQPELQKELKVDELQTDLDQRRRLKESLSMSVEGLCSQQMNENWSEAKKYPIHPDRSVQRVSGITLRSLVRSKTGRNHSEKRKRRMAAKIKTIKIPFPLI